MNQAKSRAIQLANAVALTSIAAYLWTGAACSSGGGGSDVVALAGEPAPTDLGERIDALESELMALRMELLATRTENGQADAVLAADVQAVAGAGAATQQAVADLAVRVDGLQAAVNQAAARATEASVLANENRSLIVQTQSDVAALTVRAGALERVVANSQPAAVEARMGVVEESMALVQETLSRWSMEVSDYHHAVTDLHNWLGRSALARMELHEGPEYDGCRSAELVIFGCDVRVVEGSLDVENSPCE